MATKYNVTEKTVLEWAKAIAEENGLTDYADRLNGMLIQNGKRSASVKDKQKIFDEKVLAIIGTDCLTNQTIMATMIIETKSESYSDININSNSITASLKRLSDAGKVTMVVEVGTVMYKAI